MARQLLALWVLCIMSVWIVNCLGTPADTSLQLKLIERIDALEKQGQEQAEKIQMLESRLEEQDNRLVSQEQTISDYKQKVADLEQTVTELKLKQHHEADKGSSGSDVLASSGQNPGIIRQNISEHREKSSVLMGGKRAVLDAEGPIAFHAIIQSTEVTNIGVNKNIVFHVILTNLGGGYQSQSGLFVAPQPGIYIFSTSIMSDYRGQLEIRVTLVKNGQTLARAFAHSDSGRHDQGSVTVVTQMAAGDEVWVANYALADTSLWGNYYDSFMGCLVLPL